MPRGKYEPGCGSGLASERCTASLGGLRDTQVWGSLQPTSRPSLHSASVVAPSSSQASPALQPLACEPPPFPPRFSETPAPDPCRTPAGTPHLEFGELTPKGNPQPTRQKTSNQPFLWSEDLGAPGEQWRAPGPASPLLFTAPRGLPALLPGTTPQTEHAGYAHTGPTLMEPCGAGMWPLGALGTLGGGG